MKNDFMLFIAILFFALGCTSEPVQQAENESVPVASSEKLWTESDRRFILAELDRTTKALRNATEDLGDDQWFFQENENRWSMAAIVEHLTVQNELHYREITALAKVPEMPQYLPATTGQDEHFRAYATAPENSQAKWYLQPIGRFGYRRQSIDAFLRARDGLRDFVESTDVDLRKHFTFRAGAGEKPIAELQPGDVRDLHQLLLTGIAHTDRHLRQIRNIKGHRKYPRNI